MDTGATRGGAPVFGSEETPVVLTRARTGRGTRPPRVLLLHGLASSPGIWDTVLPLLAPECEVWTAGLPWRGAGVPAWSERSPAAWIDEVVTRMPGVGPDVVVAHSFAANGLLAWLDTFGSASEGPGAEGPVGEDPRERGSRAGRGRPHGVVLAAPFYRSSPEDFDWDTISYYLNHFDRILQNGVRVRSGGRLSEDVEHSMALKVRDRVGCLGWMRFFDSYLATPALRTERMLLPVVVIGGSEDFAAFPRDAHALGEALPEAAVHILPGAGHFTMAERPREFADLANGLIRTVCAREQPGDQHSAMEYNS